jgi:hypothetical protein
MNRNENEAESFAGNDVASGEEGLFFEVPLSPTVQVSWGELVDKMTILEIKEARLTTPEAIANVRRELAALVAAVPGAYSKNADLAEIKAELRSVNQTLWDVEDRIRAKEAAKRFDQARAGEVSVFSE